MSRRTPYPPFESADTGPVEPGGHRICRRWGAEPGREAALLPRGALES
jgi:hypothetical protein